MLKNKRLVSFIAMLAICFSFLVPAFVAPDQAAASSTYTVLSAPTKTKDQSPGALGSVEIYVPNTSAFTETYDYLTISLPDKVNTNYTGTIPSLTWMNYSDANSGNIGIKLSLPSTVDGDTNGISSDAISVKVSSATSFELRIAKEGVTEGKAGKINVYFDNLDWSDFGGGDVNVSFVPPFSGTTAFTAGSAVIGRISSDTGTTAMAKSIKTVSKAPQQTIDTIIIAETSVGSITTGTVIKLKLPAGYSWDKTGAVVAGSWAFDGNTTINGKIDVSASGRDLTVTIKDGFTRSPANASGRINIGITGYYFKINVPDTASNGDVTCSVSGEGAGGITDQEIVIAKVGDYGITVTEGEKKEVIAGHVDQKLGSFYIEESLAGSLVKNRTIKLKLPAGVKWQTAPSRDITGSVVLSSGSFNTDYDEVTYTVTNDSYGGTASKIKLYDAKVEISPAFSGPIKVTISGTAGVTGEVTLADCLPIVTLTADASKKLIIGMPNQVASDITIAESQKGAIMDSVDTKVIRITLPAGVTFSAKPTVKVVEGDLEIDTYKLTNSDTALDITIKSSSSKASKIVISDVKLTLDRTVPEGDLKAKLAVVEEGNKTYALDETTLWDTKDSAGSVVIGTCVTPAPANQGRSALFTIGSNIATINGTYVIMDAAPYIKASRTYIPVRYLADALGATTEWDPATQTATLTLGDKSVVLVIGSKIEKVNGADVTMDVAPEIVNGRTMLPARYVAEGLGYQVGWNGVTKQVIIQ